MNLYARPAPAVPAAPGEHRLNDAFLVAATINALGCIDLQSVRRGKPDPRMRAEFSLGPSGDFVQRCYSLSPSGSRERMVPKGTYEKEPLDMVFLAECLTHALGPVAPELFKLTDSVQGRPARFRSPGATGDRQRLRLLHEAFNLYLLAYEERLI